MRSLLLLFTVFFFSCSSDDSATQINGRWQLVKSAIYTLNEAGETVYTTADLHNEGIFYDFNSSYILSVSKDGGPQSAGTYDFWFGRDHLGGGDDAKVLLVKINDDKWSYAMKHDTMILGKSYVDGPDLILERK